MCSLDARWPGGEHRALKRALDPKIDRNMHMDRFLFFDRGSNIFLVPCQNENLVDFTSPGPQHGPFYYSRIVNALKS